RRTPSSFTTNASGPSPSTGSPLSLTAPTKSVRSRRSRCASTDVSAVATSAAVTAHAVATRIDRSPLMRPVYRCGPGRGQGIGWRKVVENRRLDPTAAGLLPAPGELFHKVTLYWWAVQLPG